MKLLACLAWLMGVQAPANLEMPEITELPIAESEALCTRIGTHASAHAVACYDPGLARVVVPAGRIDPGSLLHELAHHVQHYAGVDMTDWRAENQAEYAARKAAAGWCVDA